jgi:hypothetical protein
VQETNQNDPGDSKGALQSSTKMQKGKSKMKEQAPAPAVCDDGGDWW